jgi:hypothetical protein
MTKTSQDIRDELIDKVCWFFKDEFLHYALKALGHLKGQDPLTWQMTLHSFNYVYVKTG